MMPTRVLMLAGLSLLAGFVLTTVFMQYGRLDFALLIDAIRHCF